MEDLRRRKLGEMLLDITKYIVTIVIIGSVIGDKVHIHTIVIGMVLAIVSGIIGYFLLPPTEETKTRKLASPCLMHRTAEEHLVH